MVWAMDNIADSAHQLQRAAGWLQKRASDPDAVTSLPVALAHVEEALDRLATAMVKVAQEVEDTEVEAGAEGGALSPSARALRWHLFNVSTRLRGAGDACPDTRRWARTLLAERDPADDTVAAWHVGPTHVGSQEVSGIGAQPIQRDFAGHRGSTFVRGDRESVDWLQRPLT
jgi:hypothetical protein